MKENTVILVDDDGISLNKIKALLESSSIKVLTAENLYELMSKIYKYNIETLIFNPNLVWINVIEFITELKKVNNELDFKIFFISENIDKNLKEEAKKLNVEYINNNSNINKIVQYLNK
ncbi:response regulator [Brachyspira sp. SAP_772]|uniref:response regulator n=1 Tax=Brachyspira sp. SAP_772 TaxID=2608385 RepID=UPI0012F4DFFD|nr:response regulator [Brachyspira sp. SAP_772]